MQPSAPSLPPFRLPPPPPSLHSEIENVSDLPPTYNEAISLKTFPHPPIVHHARNYGACPTPDPPPYSSYELQSGKDGPNVLEPGTTASPVAPSSNFHLIEPSIRKKYVAYGFCIFFLIIIMIAAYLGRNSRKHHNYRYRHNYDWNF